MITKSGTIGYRIRFLFAVILILMLSVSDTIFCKILTVYKNLAQLND